VSPLLIGPVFDVIKQVLSAVGLDPEAKAKAQAQAYELLNSGTFADRATQALALSQLEVDKTEAAAPSLFVSGWRPSIGWVCSAALAFQYIARPIVGSIAIALGAHMPELPGIDDNLWQLMTGMLGLGVLRTVEKVNGAA
jgi:hypothetical protein